MKSEYIGPSVDELRFWIGPVFAMSLTGGSESQKQENYLQTLMDDGKDEEW